MRMLRLKVIFARFLTSKGVSPLISLCFPKTIPSLKMREIRINNSPSLAASTKALFFCGLYESGELRFISKYLRPNENVIELGASIGVISSFVGRYRSPRKLVCVEANSDLIDQIRSNLRLNRVSEFTLINKAIGDGSSTSLWFLSGQNNTTGQVSLEWKPGAKRISSITLHQLVKENNLNDFVLISDIEGAEGGFLKNPLNFEKCKMLIIELHKTSMDGADISVEDLKTMIRALGFSIIDEYGPIVVAQKDFV
jgi:FkbM family methyltransferase